MTEPTNLDPLNQFRSDGRGPELVKLVWGLAGAKLIGAEYRNPDEPTPMHVRFLKAQTVMMTPDDVVGLDDLVGLVDLGQTPWLKQISPHHLGSCSHVRARFYDEAVEVICEGIEINAGGLNGSQKTGPPDRR